MDIAYPQLISLSWYRRSNFIEPSQTRTSSQNHRGKIAPPCRLNSVPKFDEPTRISKYFGLWDTKIKRLSTDKLIARYVYFDSINLLRSIFIEDYIPWIVLKWIVFWTNKLILNLKKKIRKIDCNWYWCMRIVEAEVKLVFRNYSRVHFTNVYLFF